MVVFQCEWCKSRDFVNKEALLIHLQAETCTSPSPSPSSLISTPLQNYYVSQITTEIDQIMLLLDDDAHLHSLAKPQIAQFEVAQAAAARCADNDPFNRLPYEIILEIINKIIDFKTLCILNLVSKSLSSMVMKANIISVTESSKSACTFLEKFTHVKSLCIKFPKSCSSITYDDDKCLFKWKIKFSNRLDTFVFLSPVNNINSSGVNQAFDFVICKTALKLLVHATERLVYLGDLAKKFPLLEYVCLTEFGKDGTVSVKGRANISQLKNMISEETEIKKKLQLYGHKDVRTSWYNTPLLELTGGYVMKEVTMILVERNDLPNDSFMSFFDDVKDNTFEHDKDEAAYHEAMMKILMNYKNPIRGGFLS